MTDIVSQRAVFVGAGESFRVEDVLSPLPRAGEALVEIEMCTICGSDLHTIEGRRPLSGPMVLGHEILGRVAQLPKSGVVSDVFGTPLKIGDRVTWSLHAYCGQCFWCNNRLSPKCEQLFKYGHEPISDTIPMTGGFATHCQLRPGTAIVRVPEQMDARLACPANCATATVAAAFRQVEDCRGRCVLIFGAGMLGLTGVAWASEAGAESIVVVDPNRERAALAMQLGATVVCQDVAIAQQEVQGGTAGRGADASFDFCGHPDAVLGAIHLLRTGGQAVLVGAVFPTESISLSPEMVVRKCLRICGVHNYLAEDLVAALRFLERTGGKYPLASLVSATYELSEIARAVQHAASGTAVRVAVTSSARSRIA